MLIELATNLCPRLPTPVLCMSCILELIPDFSLHKMLCLEIQGRPDPAVFCSTKP